MGKQLVLNDVMFNTYIDNGTISTSDYTDITSTFISTYNLEWGFYGESLLGKTTLENPHGQSEAFIKRYVAIDFVPKSAGEFIVVIPSTYIATFRYNTMNANSWEGANVNGSIRSNDLINGVNIHSDRILQLNPDVRTDKWSFQCGVANGNVISIDTLISRGFKVYQKNN